MPHYKPEGYECKYCGAVFKTPYSLGGRVTSAHSTADLDRIIEMKRRLKNAHHY